MTSREEILRTVRPMFLYAARCMRWPHAVPAPAISAHWGRVQIKRDRQRDRCKEHWDNHGALGFFGRHVLACHCVSAIGPYSFSYSSRVISLGSIAS